MPIISIVIILNGTLAQPQVTGLGTALKILFSGQFEDQQQSPLITQAAGDESGTQFIPPADGEKDNSLNLTRTEVVALVNAIGRWG